MHSIIIRFISILPTSLTIIPYHIAYGLIRLLALLLGIKCWARNSYHFNRINPGISDIDFTLLINRNSAFQLFAFIEIYTILKKFIPILGEVNCYYAEEIDLLKFAGNYFELKRDPILLTRISSTPPEILDRTIFLLRMIEADTKNLQTRPSIREKKWVSHFAETGLPMASPLNLTSILDSVINTIRMNSNQDEVRSLIRDYFQLGIAECYSKHRKNKTIRYLMMIFPHRWIVHANGINDIDICLKSNQFNEDEFLFIAAQIRWELYGLISQSFSPAKNAEALSYLRLLGNFIDQIQLTQHSRLKDHLKDQINEFRSHFVR